GLFAIDHLLGDLDNDRLPVDPEALLLARCRVESVRGLVYPGFFGAGVRDADVDRPVRDGGGGSPLGRARFPSHRDANSANEDEDGCEEPDSSSLHDQRPFSIAVRPTRVVSSGPARSAITRSATACRVLTSA